ncbi:hypothetical protein NEOLEDRAFT_1184258 [Neolentinus lepideus HHB14362 ss-1]|uniref:Uncharacterized protein n=1 Tax=Neolentinus lepideus HHB14362 ss-1 TaxID=1314782 RepID=A0A165MKZ6_9AGAM|nr:hypothetical protein NEOLEDRAFT_1184258 [Neolentinus lepideus HHB14362 ss-1]
MHVFAQCGLNCLVTRASIEKQPLQYCMCKREALPPHQQRPHTTIPSHGASDPRAVAVSLLRRLGYMTAYTIPPPYEHSASSASPHDPLWERWERVRPTHIHDLNATNPSRAASASQRAIRVFAKRGLNRLVTRVSIENQPCQYLRAIPMLRLFRCFDSWGTRRPPTALQPFGIVCLSERPDLRVTGDSPRTNEARAALRG